VTSNGQPRICWADGRRRERDSALQAAEIRKMPVMRPRVLGIEAPLQILVGSVDFRAVENGHDGDAENHHRDGQTEIELHKAHAVGVTERGVEMKVIALACVAMMERPWRTTAWFFRQADWLTVVDRGRIEAVADQGREPGEEDGPSSAVIRKGQASGERIEKMTITAAS